MRLFINLWQAMAEKVEVERPAGQIRQPAHFTLQAFRVEGGAGQGAKSPGVRYRGGQVGILASVLLGASFFGLMPDQ